MKLVQVREGPMKLWVPKISLQPPHKAPVFYNPNMEQNRALSSLALGACLPLLSGKTVLDAFCACGARGIRYALDNPLSKVVFLDANPDAIKLTEKNVLLNDVKNGAFFEGFFQDFPDEVDIVEVDPFGTPAPFISKALSILKNPGLVSVTATDLATLCGRNNKPAERRYDALPLYVEYAHELGLRIVLGKIARDAEKLKKHITPSFSFYKDHYVKTFALVGTGKKKHRLGFVSHCLQCGNRVEGNKNICPCGKRFVHAGPLWVGNVCEFAVLEGMASKADGKTASLIETLKGENGLPPYHFDVHKICSKHCWPIRKMDDYLGKLKKKGFEATRTHYAPTAFKTNAPFDEVLAAFQP